MEIILEAIIYVILLAEAEQEPTLATSNVLVALTIAIPAHKLVPVSPATSRLISENSIP